MIGFLIRRVLQALLVIFLVTVFTLALVHLFPGGPIRSLLGPRATPAQVAHYNQLYGFDQPFYVQYLKWLRQPDVLRRAAAHRVVRHQHSPVPAVRPAGHHGRGDPEPAEGAGAAGSR